MPRDSSRETAPWTAEEDEKLLRLNRTHGNRWSDIAKVMGTRSGQQCAQRWRHKVNPDIRRERWSAEEDAKLKRLQEQYGHRWAEIARRMGGRTDQQCMGRWRRHLDPNVTRGAWDAGEDAALRALYAELGPKWSRICESVPGRTAQQCRARWFQIDGSVARGGNENHDVDLDDEPAPPMVERRLAGNQPRSSRVMSASPPTPDAQPFHKILEESARAAAAGSLDPYPMEHAPLLAAVQRFAPTTSKAIDPTTSWPIAGAEAAIPRFDERLTKRRRDSDATSSKAAGYDVGGGQSMMHGAGYAPIAIGVPTPPQRAREASTSADADGGDKLSFLYTVALNETTQAKQG